MRAVRGQQGYKHAKVKKLIFLGLDGLDPGLAERYMAEGKLPNLSRLREQGGFHRLRTTFPALSPVAWSTFATGVNPARHSMFDFLNRNLRSYMPELSSTRVRDAAHVLKIGKYRIPLSRPIVEMRRKSRTFWQILGEHQIASTILRVPITFPPEKFNGRMLSAMCTPDLLGTQGTFALYTTRHTSRRHDGERKSLPADELARWHSSQRRNRRPAEPDGRRRRTNEDLVPGVGFPKGKDAAALRIAERRYIELVPKANTRRGSRSPFTRRSASPCTGIVRFLLAETVP